MEIIITHRKHIENNKLHQVGDIIYAALEENTVIESAPWAIERVDRVLKRLHAVRGKGDQFSVVIPWTEEFTAFTAPGRYIFFARRLFQLCESDDMAAMVIAHEMSHHDLGHMDVFPDWLGKVTNLDVQVLILALYRIVETRIHGPEKESDADRNALELCVQAGYNGQDCIRIFKKLEKFSLDMGDIQGVYGPDEPDGELPEDASWSTKIRTWLYQRKRGYLSIRDRHEILLKHLDRITSGTSPA